MQLVDGCNGGNIMISGLLLLTLADVCDSDAIMICLRGNMSFFSTNFNVSGVFPYHNDQALHQLCG